MDNEIMNNYKIATIFKSAVLHQYFVIWAQNNF
jgi:hypothetical protein